MILANVLRRPVITEKSTILGEENKYVFEIAPEADKYDVARAVEYAYPNVKVVSVNTYRRKGKTKRVGTRARKRPDVKRAIVTLAPGNTIPLFEGA